VQSTQENKFLSDKVEVSLTNISYEIDLYNTSLGKRWVEALKENLRCKRILEKNFCFLGFADSKRDLSHLVRELNKHINQINSFEFNPSYRYIHAFRPEDFQYSASLPAGICHEDGKEMEKPGLRLKHESCNLLHRYFEELQGTAWKLSEFYKQADIQTRYSIRQLNNLCHEIESWVLSYRKKILDPDWVRPSQITTFLNAPRHDLHKEDFELFKNNRYDRELGGVYLHWSQIGKTLFEVFRDEGGTKMDEVTCSEINHQKYYSGEFDVEWGQSISEDSHDFKRQEIARFKDWLKLNSYDWQEPRLSLGYAKIGQINLEKTFGNDFRYKDLYHTLSMNLDITKIKVISDESIFCDYPYTLDSDDWQNIQIKELMK
jgi:hypothetical protein